MVSSLANDTKQLHPDNNRLNAKPSPEPGKLRNAPQYIGRYLNTQVDNLQVSKKWLKALTTKWSQLCKDPNNSRKQDSENIYKMKKVAIVAPCFDPFPAAGPRPQSPRRSAAPLPPTAPPPPGSSRARSGTHHLQLQHWH